MRRFIAGPVAAVVLAAVTALPARAQSFNYFTTGQFTGGGTTCNYTVDASTQTCGGAGGALGLTFTGTSQATGGYSSGSTIQLGTFTPVGSGTITVPPPDVMFRLFINQTDPTTGSASIVGAFTGTFTQGDGANFSNLFWSPNQQSVVIGPTTYTLIFDNAVNGQGPNDCPTASESGSGICVAAVFPTTIKAKGFVTSTVPEPSSMALLGTGLVGLVPMIRRKKSL